MQAIRITQKLESDTLYLPQLRPWLGKNVEIVVQEIMPNPVVALGSPIPVRSLVGSVLQYDDPFGPAIEPDEWEANR